MNVWTMHIYTKHTLNSSTYQYDSQCVQGDELLVYDMSVGLQKAGHQSHHIKASVSHWWIQHPPCGVQDGFLIRKQTQMILPYYVTELGGHRHNVFLLFQV